MRPHDIVVLLKILTTSGKWQYRDLSSSLLLSLSEIAESLHRSHLAGLIDVGKKNVFRLSLMEFLEHGLHYVFPQHPGTLVLGVPTAHSYGPFKNHFPTENNFVWPDENGSMSGLAILPLYKGVPMAVIHDPRLHVMLASIDIIRVGTTRELKLALEVLKKEIL